MEPLQGTRGILYVIACAAPAAGDVHHLVPLAQAAGWQVHVVTTPVGERFVNVAELERLTGDLVRSTYRMPPSRRTTAVPHAILGTHHAGATRLNDSSLQGQGKGAGVTALPQDSIAVVALLSEKNLRAIRDALIVPEDREAFDAGLKIVLDEVTVSLDLEALNTFVHRWRISACDTAKDPEGRHQMHARAQQVLAGKPLPQGRSWREILAARGVEVQVYAHVRGT